MPSPTASFVFYNEHHAVGWTDWRAHSDTLMTQSSRWRTMHPLPIIERFAMHERFIWGYSDPRVLMATVVGAYGEHDMRAGRVGPPHPSWCQELWNS